MASVTPDLRLYPLMDTKLYCLVTEVHVGEQLAQGCYLQVQGWQRPNHYTIRPQII